MKAMSSRRTTPWCWPGRGCSAGWPRAARRSWCASSGPPAAAWDSGAPGRSDKGGPRALLWNQDPRLPLVQERYLGRKRFWRARLPPERPGELNRLEGELAVRSVARKRLPAQPAAAILTAVIVTLSLLTGVRAGGVGPMAKDEAKHGLPGNCLPVASMFQELDPKRDGAGRDDPAAASSTGGGRRSTPTSLDVPEAQSQLRETLGNVYYGLGAYPEAEGLFRQVLAHRRRTLGEEDPDTLIARSNLANVARDRGRLPGGGDPASPEPGDPPPDAR